MNNENTKYADRRKGTDANHDPRTGPPGARPVSTYATYQPAYRTGYEGPSRYPGQNHEEVAADLHREYETCKGNAGLAWSKAKPANRDTSNRVEATLPVGSNLD